MWGLRLWGRRAEPRRARLRARLAVEVLEDRSLPSGNASGVLSGVAFIDASGDGVHQANEPVLPGVPVTLAGTPSHGGDAVNVVATTDANGAFSFLNILPGTYHLSAGPAQGLLDGNATFGNLTTPDGVTLVPVGE